jgi:hypothetical protein
MLSRSVEQRLFAAREQQQAGEYAPNNQVLQRLGNTSLIMFVGPTTIGKSMIINDIIQSENETYSSARSFTTRPPTDPDMANPYDFIPHTDEGVSTILDKIDAGDLVQYVVHPSTGNISGSEPHHYHTPTTLIDLLPDHVNIMRQLPFKETQTVGIIAPSQHWALWFNERFPAYDQQRRRRIQEAGETLQWIDTHQSGLSLVENRSHNLTGTVEETLAVIQKEREADPRIARELAKTLRNCLTAAESLGYREGA